MPTRDPAAGTLLRPHRPGLAAAVARLLAVWAVLSTRPGLEAFLDPQLAGLVAFSAATVVAVLGMARVSGGRIRAGLGAGLVGVGLGWLAHPVLCAWIAVVGLALGLEPQAGGAVRPSGPADLLATLVLAPVFEEIVYRAGLLPPLARAIGPAPALLLSSALFALSHDTSWARLGTFVAGHGLGALWLRGRSLPLCIGAHAGLNLAGCLGVGVASAEGAAAGMPGLAP